MKRGRAPQKALKGEEKSAPTFRIGGEGKSSAHDEVGKGDREGQKICAENKQLAIAKKKDDILYERDPPHSPLAGQRKGKEEGTT